ncbi:MAG: HEAT repeat domain-containing protein [Cyanobacteriota bacterium]|nr:HEAT repeat domain-containing protein [Cyanobacteriota bacterium]
MPDSATLHGLIRAVTDADSSEALVAATHRLAASRQAAAAATLVQVLGFNNPGAAVAAVDGLIALGQQAVPALLDQLDPRNYGARAWAVRALAGIGDVRGLELLEEALATDVGPSVRRAAARGLGQLRLADLSAERRSELHERCLRALEAATADGEWVVRYAVATGLEGLARDLGQNTAVGPVLGRARAALQRLATGQAGGDLEEAPVVQLRARLALDRLPPP